MDLHEVKGEGYIPIYTKIDFTQDLHEVFIKDIFWNIEQLTLIIDEITGITVAEALCLVTDYIASKRNKKKISGHI